MFYRILKKSSMDSHFVRCFLSSAGEPNSQLDFLRNNDIAPARRALIRKTLERGALWVKEWRDGVTHVIVDKDLCYNDVISFLKIPSLPVSTCMNVASRTRTNLLAYHRTRESDLPV